MVNRFDCKGITAILLSLLFVMAVSGTGTSGEITPTDVYYLAKSVDDSLVRMYQAEGVFEKKRISNNLSPRNVFEKAIDITEKFNMLHNYAVARDRLAEVSKIGDMSRIAPSDVYAVLSLIKDCMTKQGVFAEYSGEKNPKVPSDVFHLMRQLSWRCSEIAKKKGIVTNWATPAQVYESAVTAMLPAVQAMAGEAGVKYEDYSFPRQPVSGVVPRYVYNLLYHTYGNISKYYIYKKGNYEPVVFLDINDCDDISPADVFDLTQVIASELKADIGVKALSPETAEVYAKWKESHAEILPGHVFRLIQYNYILSKKVLEGRSEQ